VKQCHYIYMDFNTGGPSTPSDAVPPIVPASQGAMPTPQDEFKNQFGADQPPVIEAPVVDTAPVVSPNFNTVAEAVSQPQQSEQVQEKSPEEKLEEIWEDIGEYLGKTKKAV
jgi:hypothetical protein